MQFRHEVKHEISAFDLPLLRQRLRAVMKPDSNAVNGQYEVRSLYFDNLADKALREKLDGTAVREKYRMRLYNFDLSAIFLERKFKCGDLGHKTSVALTPGQAQALVEGDLGWMKDSADETVLAFYSRILTDGLKAKVLVDYTREPFVFAPGNVRVTLDYHIRTGMRSADFLNPSCITVPIRPASCILEVKWGSYLPDVIRDVIQLDGRRTAAFSKYQAARMYD